MLLTLYIISQKQGKILQICRIFRWYCSQGNNSIGFPDYENGYSVSSDFIANKNGWLYNSAIGRWIVLINGKPVRQQVINSDQVDGAIAPISSGDKVQVVMTQGGSRLNEIIFYPCK